MTSFCKKYILLTLQSIADPKNQLKPCIKPTERGIVVIFKLKNDDFMPIFFKCYQNRYQKVTSNDVILRKIHFIDTLEHR